MTTLDGRSGTALLVIDVQNGVVGDAHDRDGVVSRIGALVERARGQQVPVVWVQHNSDDELRAGEEPWQIVPELVPADGEAVVQKRYGDSFEGTDLEDVLAAAGVGRLVVTGAETDACVRSTIHGGFTRGYDVTLVGDAHTTGDKSDWGAPAPADVIAHTNLYWQYQDAPGRTAGTADAADVVLG
ncbi:cysteine hydrolase [Phycicoccus sp. HDW14]|uniref:cysteine hydrolase family protein n=1 Tax=Phycicoccus sp. HDW14 TaxID=2714941 RepID=UPI00140D3FAB|nr:cysteine hydrolase family protein [Phycicoccus sp. HDW14]QIM20836.1 cysteine hydrolase [Phycicoccus sp. HDW14]